MLCYIKLTPAHTYKSDHFNSPMSLFGATFKDLNGIIAISSKNLLHNRFIWHFVTFFLLLQSESSSREIRCLEAFFYTDIKYVIFMFAYSLSQRFLNFAPRYTSLFRIVWWYSSFTIDDGLVSHGPRKSLRSTALVKSMKIKLSNFIWCFFKIG